MRHIMVATDGSPCADRAVDIAGALAKATGATLLVMTVGRNLPAEDVRKLARAEGGTPEALELLANQILQQASERAAHAGAPCVRFKPGGATRQKPSSKLRETSTATPSSSGGEGAGVSLDCCSGASRKSSWRWHLARSSSSLDIPVAQVGGCQRDRAQQAKRELWPLTADEHWYCARR